MKNIACIGAGYVGGPTMAVIAMKCPQYRVTVCDLNADRIAAWQTDQLPIYEPGLLEVVQAARGRNLFFTTDIGRTIREAAILFVSVNTPTKTFGEGAGKAADLQYWEKVAREIVRESTSSKVVVKRAPSPSRRQRRSRTSSARRGAARISRSSPIQSFLRKARQCRIYSSPTVS